MKKRLAQLVVPCLLFAGLGFSGSRNAAGQGSPDSQVRPPAVLVLMNESLKPGRGGSTHEKSESAFVQAFTAAKWPQNYFAMDALSGKSRSLFFVPYDSFAAWQKDADATRKNPTLSAALDSAVLADGELLESYETSVYALRDDLSLRTPVKIRDMRFMEMTTFKIRPGHGKDWEALAKMYVSAYEKMPNAHWAIFEKMYGTGSGSAFIAITPRQSLADLDQEMKDDKGLASAIGADQTQKMRDLTASAIESTESHVFMINPKMSYVPEAWVKADAEFWGQK